MHIKFSCHTSCSLTDCSDKQKPGNVKWWSKTGQDPWSVVTFHSEQTASPFICSLTFHIFVLHSGVAAVRRFLEIRDKQLAKVRPWQGTHSRWMHMKRDVTRRAMRLDVHRHKMASRGHPMLPCHVFTNPKQRKIHQDQLLTVDLVHKQNTKSNCKYVSYYHPAFVTIICLLIFALTIQKLKSVSLYLTFLHSNLFSSTHAASSYLCTAPSGQTMPLLQWEHLYHAKTDRNCFPFQ